MGKGRWSRGRKGAEGKRDVSGREHEAAEGGTENSSTLIHTLVCAVRKSSKRRRRRTEGRRLGGKCTAKSRLTVGLSLLQDKERRFSILSFQQKISAKH